MRTGSTPAAGSSDVLAARWFVRGVIAVACLTTVAPLLAWSSDVGSFTVWFVVLTIPASMLAVGIGVAARRVDPDLRRVVRVGAVAGLVGTLAYDLFRVPFVFGLGMRLLSPIESYGVLLLGAGGSSGLTDVAGWGYHVLNGMAFSVAYAVVLRGRHWGFGVAWALVLESGAVFSPFASAYALDGKYAAIALAYLAHVPYGIAVGVGAQHWQRIDHRLVVATPWPTRSACVAVGIVLAAWLNPFDRPGPAGAARLVDAVLVPEFVRTDVDGCVDVTNADAVRRSVYVGDERGVAVEPGETLRFCFDERGVVRVRPRVRPFDGGFVIAD